MALLLAKVIGATRADIAVLKVDAKKQPHIQLGTANVKPGQWVVARQPVRLGGSVTAGIVSARPRHRRRAYDQFIQISADQSGQLGGPLFCRMAR
jgi:S1-C subfamily serine protease